MKQTVNGTEQKGGRGKEFMRGMGGVYVDREISGVLGTAQQTASD